MRETSPPALMLTLMLMSFALAGPAFAQTVTVTTTLADRGFPDGLLLSGRQASSVYVPLPAGTDISNVRVDMKGRAVTPDLQRGSVVISVNGNPVDALRFNENSRAQAVVLDTLLNEGEPFRAPALDLRFRADLIANAELCTEQVDPADTLQVLPETTIAYDIDLQAITTLGDALALLPVQPMVELPAPLTPELSAAALKVSAMLANQGYRPVFTSMAGANVVAGIRLVAPSEDGAIRLAHEAERLRIDVPENADIAAFARLWQAAPSALAGEAVQASSGASGGNGALPTSFWPVPTLPGPMRVVQTADLGFDFPMLGNAGRRASQVTLRLSVAPDWSGVYPVITVHLNGQLIDAKRAAFGENILSIPLAGDALRLSNRLNVTVDRAQAKGDCPGANSGHAVQLLPGTGIDYDAAVTGGFAAVASALRGGGTLALPEAATGQQGIAYLTLASRVLHGLGIGPAPLDVTFGDSEASGPTVTMGAAGADGLLVPVRQPDVILSTSQPLASLTADATRRALDIRVLDGQPLPDPTGIYLGNGSAALIGSGGVIWEDMPTGSKRSLAERADRVSRNVSDVLLNGGVFWGLIGLIAILVVVLIRTLLKRHFRRQSSR